MNIKTSILLKVVKRPASAGYRWLWLLLALCLGITPGFGVENTLKKLKVTTKKEGDATRFFVENSEATEITVTFELQLENLQGNIGFPFTKVYPAKQVIEVFTLTPINAGKPWKYSYTSRYTIGSTEAVHDDSVVYTLPFSPGEAFRVTQGYHGQYSHTGPEEYAIDWKMPGGTPVHAARDGTVVRVKDDSDKGGPFREFESCANYVLIRHADGTVANYAHLQPGGVVVKVGQKVQAGEQIAWSGNTGFSTGPHLHFAVFKTKSGSERESIPVRFHTEQGEIHLAEGGTYRSFALATAANATAAPRAVSPKAESLWNRLPVFGKAQGGSRRSK